MRAILFTFFWLLLTASVAAAAGPATAPAAAPDATLVLQPTRSFSMPRGRQDELVLAPGGQSAYAVETIRHVNAWALLAYRWPEAIWLLAFVIGFPVLLMRWRRMRRRRGWEPGEPYCRRCGYRLTALSAEARCPECGSDVSAARARIIARPRWSRRRRLITLASIGVCVIAAEMLSFQFAQQRAAAGSNLVAGRYRWNSRMLETIGEKLGASWILQHGEQALIIAERRLDDRSLVGELEGTLPDKSYCYPQVSPDGATLWASGQDGLHAWDITSRRRKSMWIPWPEGSEWPYARFWVGTEAILSQTSKVSSEPPRLAAWNITTGQREPIDPALELDAKLIMPFPDGVRVLADRPKKTDQSYGVLRTLDRRNGRAVGSGLVQNKLDIDSPLLGVAPQMSRDASRLFPKDSHGRRSPSPGIFVHGFDLQTGEPLPLLGPFERPGLLSVALRVFANGRRVLLWFEPYGKPAWSDLEIWDVDRNRRLATLSVAPLTLDNWVDAQFSADEKTLLISSKAYSYAGVVQFWTFDLSSLPPAP